MGNSLRPEWWTSVDLAANIPTYGTVFSEREIDAALAIGHDAIKLHVESYGRQPDVKKLVAFGDNNSFKQDFSTSVYSKFPPRENPTAWVGFIRLWDAMKKFREIGTPPPIQESENSKEDVDPED